MKAFIRKRGAKYYVYLTYYCYEKGKDHQKNMGTFKYKKDAEKLLTSIKYDISMNKLVTPNNYTLIDTIKEYFDSNIDSWSPNTIRNYNNVLETAIEPFFKDTPMQDVNVEIIQKFVDLKIKTHSTSTVKNYLTIIRAALERARKFRKIDSNPTDLVTVQIKSSNIDTKSYTKEEVQILLHIVKGNVLELPVMLACLCGLRAGEIGALTWDNVDYENSTITINKTLFQDKDLILLKEPKTLSSIRTITVPSVILDKIRDANEMQNNLTKQGLLDNTHNVVVLNNSLRPYTPNYLSRQFKRFLSTNNMPHIRFHDLRHTSATLMLKSGVNIKVASKRLGHKNINTTLDIYSHVLQEMDQEASDIIEDLIYKKS